MKVAAFQSPLCDRGGVDVRALLRRRIEQCEDDGIALLCCPEAIVGGLADYAPDPAQFAVPTSGILSFFARLASNRVATIVGFTELSADGALYNSAAVLCRGTLAGVYRKRHPAMRQSVYRAGTDSPIFHLHGLSFGILLCYDSTFPALAADLASRGARLLFVPTNNALPLSKASSEVVAETRACDVALATNNRCWVVRASWSIEFLSRWGAQSRYLFRFPSMILPFERNSVGAP